MSLCSNYCTVFHDWSQKIRSFVHRHWWFLNRRSTSNRNEWSRKWRRRRPSCTTWCKRSKSTWRPISSTCRRPKPRSVNSILNSRCLHLFFQATRLAIRQTVHIVPFSEFKVVFSRFLRVFVLINSSVASTSKVLSLVTTTPTSSLNVDFQFDWLKLRRVWAENLLYVFSTGKTQQNIFLQNFEINVFKEIIVTECNALHIFNGTTLANVKSMKATNNKADCLLQCVVSDFQKHIVSIFPWTLELQDSSLFGVEAVCIPFGGPAVIGQYFLRAFLHVFE